jgi:REP element-mobilizing transposase RayT
MRNNRDYKNLLKDHYYHVYNRGNEKACIFKDREDFLVFLFFMNESIHPEMIECKTAVQRYRRTILPQNSFTLNAYCLMPNHYHLLIRQNSDIPISKLITKICTSYSKYFNKKYGRVGRVFQDIYKSVAVESDSQLYWLVEYIHQNPVRAGLVKTDFEYEWSSLRQ